MTQATDDPTGALLAELTWVRALARRLCRDPDDAEDLAQDAMIAALGQPRDRPPSSWRGWLRTVLRNRAGEAHRARMRRAEREHRAARRDADDSTADTVARLAQQRRLLDAVEALDEPYRTAIRMRYLDELPPRRIAARLDRPIRTVEAWLRRGLQQLRARLAHEHRGEGAWWSALLPLCVSGHPPAFHLPGLETLGATLMGTKLKILSVAAVAAVCVVAWPRSGEAGGTVAGPVASRGVAAARDAGTGGNGAADPARRAVRSPIPDRRTPAASAPTPTPTRVLIGKVLDVRAAPRSGIRLVFESSDDGEVVALTSGPAGRFEQEIDDVRGTVRTADTDGFVTVLAGRVVPDSDTEPVVIVAPSVDLAGRVVDSDGRPVGGAMLDVAPPDGFAARFGDVLDASRAEQFVTRSAQGDGRFALAAVPFGAGFTLQVRHAAYQPFECALPPLGDAQMEVVLARPEGDAGEVLHGRVLTAHGVAAADARVSAGTVTTVTDERGEFRLDLRRAAATERVVAVRAGSRAARMARPEPGGWPAWLELQLGGAPLTIAGRAVGPDGAPLAGAQAWVADPTLFGLIGGLPAQLESLSAGARVVGAGRADGAPEGAGTFDITATQREPNSWWSWVTTREDGRFEIPGLEERSYTVHVMDPRTLQLARVDSVAAGTADLVVTLAAEGIVDEVHGRLVSRSGRPLPGIDVALRRRSFASLAALRGGGTLDASVHSPGAVATTDAEGRFRFERVPARGAYLYVLDDAVMEHFEPLEGKRLDAEITVTVAVRCHLEVVSDGAADSITVLDADGRRVGIFVMRANSVNVFDAIAIVDGRTGVLAVRDDAAVLQLRRGTEVLEEVPLSLTPGEVTTVRR